MKMNQLKEITTSLLAGGLAAAAPQFALAEQVSTTGVGTLSAPAHLDMQIVIPKFLLFRVGTVGATIDQITFSPTAASLGSSAPVAGTGGDAAGTGSNVAVLSNAGQVTITPTNNSGGAGMGTGIVADGFIDYNQITSTPTLPALPAPVLSNTGGTSALPTLTGKVTNLTGIWNFAYANTTIPSAGIYGGNANGGRITYTATTP